MSRIFSPTLDGRFAPVHVIGMAATEFVPEHDAALDELVFAAMSAALAECGLRKQDLGLSVQASLDVYDGRSISSGLTTAAAGGYLSDSYRIEGDGGLAITAAAQAVASGDVDVAAAVAVFNPEISGSPERRRAFLEQLSSLAFEPLFDRPVGMTAQTSWALHAAKAVEAGEMSIHDLAALAAEEISRGASRRSVRSGPITADDVLASAALAWPLHELMLPAPSAGAAAVILAAPARAARAIGRSLVITGLGHGTGDYTWSGEWLRDPAAATGRAAREAYRSAGVRDPEREIDVVEMSSPTPALHAPVLAALGLGSLARERVNPSGGMASNYPGVVNGVLRLLEAADWLEAHGGRAAVHSSDTLSGLVADDVTVLVVEAA